MMLLAMTKVSNISFEAQSRRKAGARQRLLLLLLHGSSVNGNTRSDLRHLSLELVRPCAVVGALHEHKLTLDSIGAAPKELDCVVRAHDAVFVGRHKHDRALAQMALSRGIHVANVKANLCENRGAQDAHRSIGNRGNERVAPRRATAR